MDTEILVHIKAPSRFVDDKRYIGIAQGILNFQPATVVKVKCDNACMDRYRPTLSSIANPSQNSLNNPSQSCHYTEGEHSNLINVLSSRSELNEQAELREAPIPHLVSNDSSISKCMDSVVGKSCVPDQSEAEVSSHLSYETPKLAGLKLMGSGVDLLVPDTERHTRKRARSNSFEDSDQAAVVSDSQPVSKPKLSFDSVYHQSPFASPLLTRSQLRLRRSDEEDAYETRRISRLTRAVDDGVSGESKPLDLCSNPPLRGTIVPSMGGPVLQLTNSVVVNQPIPDQLATRAETQMDEVKAVLAGQHQSTLHIPLTETELSAAGGVKTGEIALGVSPLTSSRYQYTTKNEPKMSGSQNVSTLTTTNTDSVSSPNLFNRIRLLPLVINSPMTYNSSLSAPARAHPILRATAEALSLPMLFKPESMSRVVAEWERGYWLIPVDIITSEKADNIRTGYNSQPSGVGEADWRPLFKHVSLIEDEFLEIWEDLNRFVGSGNAGCNVRILRRGLAITTSKNEGSSRAYLYLQVYCYGEAIPYVYAMLLVCTRMYVLCRPVQWVSTQDDKAVLTMTGHEILQGTLQEWTRYSNAQGKRYWGCSSSKTNA